MAKEDVSRDEQIGFHKGALSTLAKEREEFQKVIAIVEQLMQMHVKALKELGVDLSSVNQTINTDLRRAMWAHAGDLQRQDIDVELKSEAAGTIWEQLKKYLPVFALFKSLKGSSK